LASKVQLLATDCQQGALIREPAAKRGPNHASMAGDEHPLTGE
jgi:hypothetical protein